MELCRTGSGGSGGTMKYEILVGETVVLAVVSEGGRLMMTLGEADDVQGWLSASWQLAKICAIFNSCCLDFSGEGDPAF